LQGRRYFHYVFQVTLPSHSYAMSQKAVPVSAWWTARFRRRLRAIVIVTGGLLCAALLLSDELAESRARRDLLLDVVSASGILVNGRQAEDSSVALVALSRVSHVASHHSGPRNPVRIDLEVGDKRVGVVIARDSERPNELWVYLAGSNWYNDPLGRYAGRVTSSELRRWLPAPGSLDVRSKSLSRDRS
jgi:hypothetical protein